MATKKKIEEVQELPKKVPAPPTPNQIVGSCPDTGAKIAHVAQSNYRQSETGIEVCGTAQSGDPDGNWTTIDRSEVPLKALSMLGLT